MIFHLILLLVLSECHSYDDDQDYKIVFDGPFYYNYQINTTTKTEKVTEATKATKATEMTEATEAIKTTEEPATTTEATTTTSIESNNEETKLNDVIKYIRHTRNECAYQKKTEDNMLIKKLRQDLELNGNFEAGASPFDSWMKRTLIIEGTPITYFSCENLENPLLWHVGIYNKGYTPYKQICGGSLVSPTAVISAAHCFWSSVSGQQPPEQFAVAAGKIYRAWNAFENTIVEKRDVIEIKIPARYLGIDTNFQHDIAVVHLDSPILTTPDIKPICVNFDPEFDKYQLKAGNLGTIMGWGLTAENGTASPVLNFLELPYVEVGECLANAKQDYQKYITPDKICAGVKTGKAICKGDSGGGLGFFEDKVPFLRGVASTSPNKANSLCNPEAISGFTHVQALKDFILDNIPNVEDECIENYPEVNMIYAKHRINKGDTVENKDGDRNGRKYDDNENDDSDKQKDNLKTSNGNEHEDNNGECKTQNSCVCNCNCGK